MCSTQALHKCKYSAEFGIFCLSIGSWIVSNANYERVACTVPLEDSLFVCISL